MVMVVVVVVVVVMVVVLEFGMVISFLIVLGPNRRMQPVVMAPKNPPNQKPHRKKPRQKTRGKQIGKYRGGQWQAAPNPGEHAMG